MRRKNDTLIKYFQLANTMFLTNEEFGALVRKIMIEDDKNEIRYENIDEETKEDLKRLEKQWKEDFKNLKKKNPLVASANASMSIQVKKSTKSFNDLVNKIENKKKTTETKTEETTAGKTTGTTTTETTTTETTTTETTTEKTTAEEKEKRDYSYSKDGYVILSEKAYEEIEKQKLNVEDIEDYMIANIEDFNNDYLTILDVLAQYKGEMLLS